jgi:hypothetical protein
VVNRNVPDRVTRQLCAAEFGALQLGWFLPLNMIDPLTPLSETEPPAITRTVEMSAALVRLHRAMTVTRPPAEVASFAPVMELPGYWSSFATFDGAQRALMVVFNRMQTICAAYAGQGQPPVWLDDPRTTQEISAMLLTHFLKAPSARPQQQLNNRLSSRKRLAQSTAETAASSPSGKRQASGDQAGRPPRLRPCRNGVDCPNRPTCMFAHPPLSAERP